MSVLQVIYYGAPGTGKSYAVDKYLNNLEGVTAEHIYRTTFHPEFTYSDFIGQILPVVKNQDITYDFQPGVFTEALKAAFQDTSRNIFLVIEEMSRGNVAGIFGDIFQLLDRDDKGGSRYPVRNAMIAKQILQIDNGEDRIHLPANFNIICTVNTSDQNVYVMDTAFKRRFDWKYIPIDPVKNEDDTIFDDDNVTFPLIDDKDNIIQVDWHSFYMKLNQYITDRIQGLGLSEDKQIGQFFIQFSKKNMNDKIIKEKIQDKLLQYLWDDIEGSTYNRDNAVYTLFSPKITSYSELYRRFSDDKSIFSQSFFEYYKS